MIKPWRERVPAVRPVIRSGGILAAGQTVESVFRGFAQITGEGWPIWAAQQLMKDYPVFDKPEEYTYANLVHYAWSRLSGIEDSPRIGRELDGPVVNEDKLYELLYRLLIDPLIFLSMNENEITKREEMNETEEDEYA